ncbi:hypothetical protein PLESTM_001324300 [Pleodorina starrii]|nr:hypothetical protein PLESTM_001324300 [Pleodorina starrii]
MDGPFPPRNAVFTYATEKITSRIWNWFVSAFHKLTWAEVSGSLGDLGTFLPLLIALVQKVDLDLGTTLIITGLYNVVGGLQFGIPMCVQPMKTIAAVALADSQPALTLPQLLLAGLFVSGCVLLLGATRLIDLFNWLVPPPVVRGVQLAVGAKLAMKGIDMALRQKAAAPTHGSVGQQQQQWRPWLGSEGLLVGAVALAVLLATTMAPPVFSPDSPEAAEEGSLGPRPTDTSMEPLLRRLLGGRRRQRRRPEAARAGAAAAAAAGDGDRNGDDNGSGGGADGDHAAETNGLLGCSSSSGSGSGSRSGAAAAAAAVAGPPPVAAAAAAVIVQEASDADGEVVDQRGSRHVGGCTVAAPAAATDDDDDVGGCGGGGGGCSGESLGRRFPSALVAMVLGLLMAVLARPGLLQQIRLGPSTPRLLHPSWSDLRAGALRAGLPQLPLTTLNSVIAVSHLANSLFPNRRDSARWRPAAVALSVALMNLGGCWLGAMPCCHGAGGLAAQYKFGARSGAAPVFLGCLKASLGLVFGGSLAALLGAFPQPLLGALLTLSGVELAASVRHTKTPRGYSFALLTAVAILGLDDTGTGFLVGLAAVAVVAVHDAAGRCMRRWSAGGGGGGGGSGGGGWGWGGWWDSWRRQVARGGGGSGEPVYDKLHGADGDGGSGVGGGICIVRA